MNRLLTVDEMHADVARIITETCAENGVTVEDFYAEMRQAWNAAVAAEESEFA